MAKMATCKVCGIEFKDSHPAKKINKFCCREHWLKYLREKGSWNKGKKWDDMYSKDTLDKLKTRITTTGEDHHMYGIKRPDVVFSNIMNNPMHSSQRKQEIQDLIDTNCTRDVIMKLFKNINQHKLYAYQRKAYAKYGKRCSICFETNGQIDVHHINGDHKKNNIENLQVLCARCHALLHKNPDALPKSINNNEPNN